MCENLSALAQIAIFALRAVDPCAPLGVLDCARWAISTSAMDGLFLVVVLCYALASLMAAGVRAVKTPRNCCTPAVHPALFWPPSPHTTTYYVKRVRKGDLRQNANCIVNTSI